MLIHSVCRSGAPVRRVPGIPVSGVRLGGQKAHFRAARGMGLYARGVRDKAIIFQYKFTPLRGFVFALLDMYIWGKKAIGTLKWSNWRIYIYIFFLLDLPR